METSNRAGLFDDRLCYYVDHAQQLNVLLAMAPPQTPESILSAYFGPFAVSTWKLLPAIEAATRRQAYTFIAPDTYNVLAREQPQLAQAIYWRETMGRCEDRRGPPCVILEPEKAAF